MQLEEELASLRQENINLKENALKFTAYMKEREENEASQRGDLAIPPPEYPKTEASVSWSTVNATMLKPNISANPPPTEKSMTALQQMQNTLNTMHQRIQNQQVHEFAGVAFANAAENAKAKFKEKPSIFRNQGFGRTASCDDSTVRLWDSATGAACRMLEGLSRGV